MTRISKNAAAVAATALFISAANAVQTLVVSGSNFVANSTGTRFSMIGVDYQPGGSSALTSTADPLSDADSCLRDAILMQRLGINTIRVYNLDVDLDHNDCASIFNAAGIYMLLDVNSGTDGTFINRADPSSTYTEEYLEHIFGIIEAFAPFPNTLGFFSGNEIINEDSAYMAPAYIRAVTRDMKEYIANNIDRSVSVGYSAAAVEEMLADSWNYLGCELANSTDSKIDFFGLNDYGWCGDSTFTESGYNTLVEMFDTTSIPVFFSEYGCNTIKPRTFTEVQTIYGEEMSVMSGGLVYEWSEESNKYGLININSTTEVTILVDYNNLAAQFAEIDHASLTAVNSTAESQTATSCAASLISETAFLNSWVLPERPSGGDALVTSGISSSNPGSLVSVTKTTMPATVYQTDATTQETGLSLIILAENDSNYPGLYKNYTPSSSSDSSSSGTATSSGSSASASASSGVSPAAGVVHSSTLSFAGFVALLFLI